MIKLGNFIAIGNIRCSNSFFDLIQEPTREQKYTG